MVEKNIRVIAIGFYIEWYRLDVEKMNNKQVDFGTHWPKMRYSALWLYRYPLSWWSPFMILPAFDSPECRDLNDILNAYLLQKDPIPKYWKPKTNTFWGPRWFVHLSIKFSRGWVLAYSHQNHRFTQLKCNQIITILSRFSDIVQKPFFIFSEKKCFLLHLKGIEWRPVKFSNGLWFSIPDYTIKLLTISYESMY